MRNTILRLISIEGKNKLPFNSIPRPFQIPFVGNWHLYKLGIYNARKYHEVLLHLYKRYGPIVYEKVGLNKPLIHVFEPEDIQTVYRNEDKMPRAFPLSEFTKAYRIQANDMSPGLGNSNDETWYKLRKSVRYLMMNANSVQKFFKHTETITDDLIGVIKMTRSNDGRIDHLRQLLGRWTLEVGGVISFDERLDYLHGSNESLGDEIVKANETVFRLGTLLRFSLPFHNYIRTPMWTKFVENEEFVHKIMLRHVKDAFSKIDHLSETSTIDDKNPFLITLLRNDELSRKDVTVLAASFLMDRLSTIVPVLMSNLYSLATNQRVQQKVYEEICNIHDGVTLDAEILNKLTYLKATLKENFRYYRMYPNGPEIGRITKKPLVLSNYEIPADSNLSLNFHVHFKSSKYFSDAEAFKPERWLHGGEGSNIPPLLLTPFGHGARTCPARKFAEQDLRLALFKIVKNFKLIYPSNAPRIDFVFHTLLCPDQDLPIQFIPRSCPTAMNSSI